MDDQESRRLRDETLRAFAKAVHTDRMVAITGAMSTRALGYPSWGEFIRAYAVVAGDIARRVKKQRLSDNPTLKDSRADRLLEEIIARADALEIRGSTDSEVIDPRVAMGVLHDGFRQLDVWTRQNRTIMRTDSDPDTVLAGELEARVAAIFLSRTFGNPPLQREASSAAVHQLIASLGVKRVATLNYDLELEAAFMLREDERQRIKKGRTELAEMLGPHRAQLGEIDNTTARLFARRASDELREDPSGKTRKTASIVSLIGAPEAGRPIEKVHRGLLRRTMGHGLLIESDVVDRERPDRLFEFATGSTLVDRHILHLHGRADLPDSLVANIRQYDRRYRLNDLYRDPFNYSLEVLFGGNPTLFVGLGMGEAELNRTLQYFVSNAPIHRPAPTFLIWNTDGVVGDRAAFMRERREDFRRRLGVQVIFEEDLAITPEALQALAPPPEGDIRQHRMDELARRLDAVLREVRGLGDVSATTPQAEILLAARNAPPIERPDAGASQRDALVRTLRALPRMVARVDALPDRLSRHWRNVRARIGCRDATGAELPLRLWGSSGLRSKVTEGTSHLTLESLSVGQSTIRRSLIFAAAEPGFGRGQIGEHLMTMDMRIREFDQAVISASSPADRMLINAGFSYDADAMLNGIADFLRHIALDPNAPIVSREQGFATLKLFKTRSSALIVINGAERFFGLDGTPLSAEVDHMLRCAQRQSDVQFVLLGTERLRGYCEAIGERLQTLFLSPEGLERAKSGRPALMPGIPPLRSAYLEHLVATFQAMGGPSSADAKPRRPGSPAGEAAASDRQTELAGRAAITPAALAALSRAVRIEPNARSRTLFDALLSPALLGALKLPCPQIFEVLRTLCFIGGAVEGEVLLHAPKIRTILWEMVLEGEPRTVETLRLKLNEVLGHLIDLRLLILFESHDLASVPSADDIALPHLSKRVGLHRALARYLRDRHGAPVNDAKLATTFNMSLFMSEPSENHTPETGFHDELGDLVDSLIAAHEERSRLGGSLLFSDAIETASGPMPEDRLGELYVHADRRDEAIKMLSPRADRITSACLRAALSLVRGYYSTSTLLRLDVLDTHGQAERLGPLSEHALRLDRLLDAFGEITTSRDIVRTVLEDQPGLLSVGLGPDPFYADDLVWLHNERGVVALAQGDLFEARDAFSAAETINREHVEHGYHGHNWRRISLNRIAVMIERGALDPASRQLERIENTLNAGVWRGDPDQNDGGHAGRGQEGQTRIDAIRILFRDNPSTPARGNRDFTREEFLITAMVTGYRGMIAHVRGDSDALESYRDAMDILRRLGERRAFAHFQRQYATLLNFRTRRDDARPAIELAIAPAQSAQQMDILHRSRIVRSDIQRLLPNDETVRRLALQDIKNALRYATLTDVWRVRIEAAASLARHMRHSGDYDTALRYAVDALTTAARYGHSLQKTALRIEIGQIVSARGDPQSGLALISAAEAIAASQDYQQASESSRRARNSLLVRPSGSNRTDITVAR